MGVEQSLKHKLPFWYALAPFPIEPNCTTKVEARLRLCFALEEDTPCLHRSMKPRYLFEDLYLFSLIAGY